jgi:hypothetical protein
MAEDSLGFHAKALATLEILNKLPETPTRRELAIQIEKLGRMAKEFDKRFPWHSVLSVPATKLRKQQGPHLHRLSQQSKRVDKLLSKMIVELAVQEVPGIRKTGKGNLNKFAEIFVKYLNSSTHEAAEQMKLQAMQRARGELKP